MQQSGIALPVTLILLFVLTLIGVATLRTSTFEESMAANSRLRQVAFNAAETTLAVAEANIGQQLRSASRREAFFGLDNAVPQDGSPGHLCEGSAGAIAGGLCTPAKFNMPSPGLLERWEDPVLDVWNNPARHISYDDYANTDIALEGVAEAPKYIVEFLGNFELKEPNNALSSNPKVRPEFDGDFISSCGESRDIEPNNQWPYCASDAGAFRITVRASAGPSERRAEVTLQSIVRYPF